MATDDESLAAQEAVLREECDVFLRSKTPHTIDDRRRFNEAVARLQAVRELRLQQAKGQT